MMDCDPMSINRHLAKLVTTHPHMAMLGIFLLERLKYISGYHNLFALELVLEILAIFITTEIWYHLRVIELNYQADIVKLKRNNEGKMEFQKPKTIRILEFDSDGKYLDPQKRVGREKIVSQDEIPATIDDHQDLREKIKIQESQIKGLLDLRRRQRQDAEGDTAGGIQDDRYLRNEIKLNDLKINRLQELSQRAARDALIAA